MTNFFNIARQNLLDPAGLTDTQLQTVLGKILGSTIDNADLYFQSTCSESWVLEDGIIKGGSYNIDRGVGVRAMSGEKTGFAYSDDIVMPALEQAAQAARSISHQEGHQQVTHWRREKGHELYLPVNPLNSLTENEKVALLQRVDAYARQQDSRVIQVNVSLAAEHDTILMMASDGHMAADVRPLVRLNVSVIVEQNGRRESGYAGGGGRFDYHYLLESDLALSFAREAVRQAVVNLDAIEAPAGTMPVVLGPGWPGVLLHEAVGHGLEGDFNRKGTSIFSDRMGEQVVSPLCTIVDDGTLPNRRGSLNVDDEGVPTQCTVLIENGVLKNYIQDKRNARLMGMQSTGNGRRESYAHVPMPRMTNTYMLPGKSTPEDLNSQKDAAMRTLYLLILINIGLLLTSCSAIRDVNPVDTTHKKNPTESAQQSPTSTKTSSTSTSMKKNPLAVSFYTKETMQLKTPYKILGRESVSKYNRVGIKRQEASIRDSMRKIAASMGGDAIIEENRNSKIVTGTVVSFENKEKRNNSV